MYFIILLVLFITIYTAYAAVLAANEEINENMEYMLVS